LLVQWWDSFSVNTRWQFIVEEWQTISGVNEIHQEDFIPTRIIPGTKRVAEKCQVVTQYELHVLFALSHRVCCGIQSFLQSALKHPTKALTHHFSAVKRCVKVHIQSDISGCKLAIFEFWPTFVECYYQLNKGSEQAMHTIYSIVQSAILDYYLNNNKLNT